MLAAPVVFSFSVMPLTARGEGSAPKGAYSGVSCRSSLACSLPPAAIMKMNHAVRSPRSPSGSSTSLPVARGVAQAPPTPDQMVATLKQNLAESQKRLRQYEWVETTAISLKGEEKSRKQQRVYYGADGKLTKLPIGEPPAQRPARRGRPPGGGRLKEESRREQEGRDDRSTWRRPPP